MIRNSCHSKQEADAEVRLRDFIVHWFERAVEEREAQKSTQNVRLQSSIFAIITSY